MKLRTTIFILFTSLPFYILSQQREKSRTIDVGLNVTSVISSFSGNGDFLSADNYPILIRKRNERFDLRIAAGIESKNNEFFDGITSSLRESSEQGYFMKVGMETILLDEDKWQSYIGFDIVGSFERDKVDIVDFIEPVNVIKQSVIGVGLSPFFGLAYKLSDRVYLSAEANFSFLYSSETTEETNPFTGTITKRTLTNERFELQPPLFLYLNFNL